MYFGELRGILREINTFHDISLSFPGLLLALFNFLAEATNHTEPLDDDCKTQLSRCTSFALPELKVKLALVHDVVCEWFGSALIKLLANCSAEYRKYVIEQLAKEGGKLSGISLMKTNYMSMSILSLKVPTTFPLAFSCSNRLQIGVNIGPSPSKMLKKLRINS